jgi:hypothetical protein
MNVFATSSSLLEIEKTLVEELSKEENDINFIGDLNLSYEDYRYLVMKLKKIQRHKYCISLLERYRCSIVTAWTFSLKFEKKERTSYFIAKRIMEDIPQHQLRYSLNILFLVFEEYGIINFRADKKNMERLFSIVEINSGILKEKSVI